MEQSLLDRLSSIEDKLEALGNSQIVQRDVLTFDQARKYLDVSASHLYKLTSKGKIPHSKPGKRVYFDRKELDRWLMQNPVRTQDEIEAEAIRRVTFGK